MLTVTYTLLELDFQPQDLNNAGQILGGGAVYQIHRNGRLTSTPLPKLDSQASVGGVQINDAGTVIAHEVHFSQADDEIVQGVVIAPDRQGVYQSRYLLAAPQQADDSQANLPVVINNLGQILTDGTDSGEVGPGAALRDELFVKLGPRGASSSVALDSLRRHGETKVVDNPRDLNNAGQFITTDAAGNGIDDLVTLRGGSAYFSSAAEIANDSTSPTQHLQALNDSAEIAGFTQLAGKHQQPEATVYQNIGKGRYRRTFLGRLSGDDVSEATAINNAGQVLGDSYSIPASGNILDTTAVIARRGENGKYGTVRDLNSLIPQPGKDHVDRVVAINDAGIILAEGHSTENGTERFMLLLPSKANRIAQPASVQRAVTKETGQPAGVARSLQGGTDLGVEKRKLNDLLR